MIPYLAVFIITILATALAHKNQSSRVLLIFYSSMAIITPSVLAGLRDVTIGTDTSLYGIPCYEVAEKTGSLALTLAASEWDPLFTIMVYLGYIGGDIAWSLFYVELFVMSNVFFAIYLIRDELKMWKAMFVFLFIFFNFSLNIMRQSMALSVCLLAFVLILKNYKKISLSLFLLAFFCHRTTIVFSLPLLLYYYTVIKGNKVKTIHIFYMLLFLLFIRPLGLFIISHGFLSGHFLPYFEEEETMYSNTNTLSQIILLGFSMIFYRGLLKKDNIDYFSVRISMFTFVFFMSSIISLWAFRMAYYFEILTVITFPRLMAKKMMPNTKIAKFVFFCFLILYWLIDIVINGVGQTYPYTSKVLGI